MVSEAILIHPSRGIRPMFPCQQAVNICRIRLTVLRPLLPEHQSRVLCVPMLFQGQILSCAYPVMVFMLPHMQICLSGTTVPWLQAAAGQVAASPAILQRRPLKLQLSNYTSRRDFFVGMQKNWLTINIRCEDHSLTFNPPDTSGF